MTYDAPMEDSPLADGAPRRALTPEWLTWLGAVGWRILATIGFAVVVVLLAIQLSTTTASILVAGIVAATFAPYVMALRARGWGRAKAAAAVTVGALLIIVAIGTVVVLAFVPRSRQCHPAIQTGVQKIQALATDVTLPPEYATMLAKVVDDLKDWVSTQAAAVANLGAIVVTITILAGLLTFYLLQDGDKAFAWAVPESLGWRRQPIRDAAVDAMQRVGGYLRGSAILGRRLRRDRLHLPRPVGIWAIALAAPLSVLVFMANFIPYIGGIVATGVILLSRTARSAARRRSILFVLLADPQRDRQQRPATGRLRQDRRSPSGGHPHGPAGRGRARRDLRPVHRDPGRGRLVAVSGAVVSVLSEEEPAPRQPGSRTRASRLGRPARPMEHPVPGGGGAGRRVHLRLRAVPLVVATGTIGIILAATFAQASGPCASAAGDPGRAALLVTVAGWGIAILVVVVSTAALIDNAPELVDTTGGGATSISGSTLVRSLVSQVGVRASSAR